MSNELTKKAHVLMDQELFKKYKLLCMKEDTNMSEDMRKFAADRVKKAEEEGVILK